MSWELTINTGNPQADQATVEHYRQTAQAQGMTLAVQQLPTGGFHVRAVPAQGGYGAPAQGGYGAPAQGGYGAAPQGGYGAAAQGGYGAPAQGGYGAAPQAQYGGAPQAGYGAPAQPGYGAAPLGGGGGWGQPAYAGGGVAGAAAVAAGGGVVDAVKSLGAERLAYLRKVYGILAVSCFLAIACGFIAMTVGDTTPFRVDGHAGKIVHVPAIVAAMLSNPGLMYGAFGLLFVATLGASFVSKVRGLNMAALLFVSALMGVEMAPMAYVAQVFAGLGDTLSANPVRDSFLFVGAVFAGITVYSFVSRKDFSYLGATLSMGFFVVFAACIIAGFVGSEIFSLAVASVGALLAAGFLLYNTSRILHGNMDDAVGDALGLLVQLRNLFMFILRILMSSRN